jgi:hypothetical protein
LRLETNRANGHTAGYDDGPDGLVQQRQLV